MGWRSSLSQSPSSLFHNTTSPVSNPCSNNVQTKKTIFKRRYGAVGHVLFTLALIFLFFNTKRRVSAHAYSDELVGRKRYALPCEWSLPLNRLPLNRRFCFAHQLRTRLCCEGYDFIRLSKNCFPEPITNDVIINSRNKQKLENQTTKLKSIEANWPNSNILFVCLLFEIVSVEEI